MRDNFFEARIHDLRYEEGSKKHFSDLRILLEKGDILSVIGRTGCGKTTFLKCMAGIIPHVQPSEFKGELRINGEKIGFEEYKLLVSFSFQETESQFIFDTVKHEIFMPLNKIEKKNAERLLEYFSIGHLINKSLTTLSTGQKKIVSIVSSLSSERPILLLDEPTANLDTANKKKLIRLLKALSKKKVIIISSHDNEVAAASNRFLEHDDNGNWKYYENKKRFKKPHERHFTPPGPAKINPGMLQEEIVKFEKVSYDYPDNSFSIRDLNLSIRKSEIAGIIGENGSGKTTLINLMTGRLSPGRGKISRNYAKFGLVLQEPEKQLFTTTVIEELVFGDKSQILGDEISHIMKIIGLSKEEHPFFISRGQKQILLISSVLLKKPDLIIIDEPFTGLDRKSIEKIKVLLDYFYNKYQPTIILLDQEEESLSGLITKIIKIEKGKIAEKNVYQKVSP